MILYYHNIDEEKINMDRIINYIFHETEKMTTLNDLLIKEGFSSAILTKLRKDSSFSLINNQPSFLNTPLKDGDHIRINIIEEAASAKIPPSDLQFEIIYEDEDILVVNKPCDMPIHPSLNNYTNSLANGVVHYYRNETSPFVFRCVNRLDRDTTGITIIAKNLLASSILSSSIRDGHIHRTYYAIVEDSCINPISKSGTINAPISRVTNSTIERCVDFENGESAITHYSLLTRKDNLALLEINLETGRTHQIRVHFKHIGHPLIGDFLYNPSNVLMKRQALHAGDFTIMHPTKKEVMHFHAPLPNDFIIS